MMRMKTKVLLKREFLIISQINYATILSVATECLAKFFLTHSFMKCF